MCEEKTKTLAVSEIKEGYLYKTENNQERVVLEIDSKNKKVTYASRGGNVKNSWKNQRNTSSLDTFADACQPDYEKVDGKKFEQIKKDNSC